MPTKNIAAASITAIAPSFRGGTSLRICLSKSSWSRRSIFEVPIFVHAKRGKTAAVPLTVAELTLGSLIGGANALLNGGLAINSNREKHQFKKIEHQSGAGLPRAGVCQSVGADLSLPQSGWKRG